MRTERIHVEWPVLKPLEKPQARLLRRTGEPLPFVPEVVERDATGGHVISVEFGLSSLAAGEYVIELVAQSGADGDRRLVAFRVVQ